MYTIKNTTGGCGVKNPIPHGNTGDVLYLVSSGVSGAATDVLYTGNGNLYSANSVTTTNVFASRYYGDGGFLSNISSNAITQPFANLVVSNAVTTTNVFATTANVGTLNVWQVSNLSSLSLTNNLYAANAMTTTNVFATTANVGTLNVWKVSNLSSLSLSNNLYAANSVTTTNLFTAGITSNVTSTVFNSDTLTIPFVNCTTLNVYSASNVMTLSIPGSTAQTSLNVTGNIYASNSVTTTNVFSTNVYASGYVFVAKNLTTTNPYWYITNSSGGNATYTSTSGAWFSSTANGTIYGNSITVGGTALASAFNTTSGTFTFPAAGTYLISVPMFINGSVAGRYAIATFSTSIKPISQYMEFTSTNLPLNEMRTWTFVKQVNENDTMYLGSPAGTITLYLAETHTSLNIFKIG